MRTHGAVVGRRFRSVTKLTTKVRIDSGYLWGSFLIAAAALKTPTRNGYTAQGVNLNSRASVLETLLTAQTRLVLPTAMHTEDRRERSTQTDRQENIDASKWRLEHRAGWGLVTNLQRPLPAQRLSLRTDRDLKRMRFYFPTIL